MKRWQLQLAKNRLSELVREAEQGPQVITTHGRDAAVVLSIKDYQRLSEPTGSLVDFFRSSPLVGIDLELERGKEYGGAIDL